MKSTSCAADGITPAELTKVHAQLRARFVYDADSVTDIAHQLGYFETIASWRAYEKLRERLDAVTPESVHAAASKYLTVQPHHRLVRAHQVTLRLAEGRVPLGPRLPQGSRSEGSGSRHFVTSGLNLPPSPEFSRSAEGTTSAADARRLPKR